jgi:uncharacterized membrane protein (DUF2068 family)
VRETSKSEVDVPKVIIVYELLFGLFELVSSLGIFLFGNRLLDTYNYLVSKELVEDPNDLTVRLTEKIIPNLFGHHIYIAFLLLAFGLIKITSGIGLIYKKVWAEHLLVIFLVILIPFELVALLRRFSIADLAYLLVDIAIVLYLIKFKPLEYYKRLVSDLKS